MNMNNNLQTSGLGLNSNSKPNPRVFTQRRLKSHNRMEVQTKTLGLIIQAGSNNIPHFTLCVLWTWLFEFCRRQQTQFSYGEWEESQHLLL